MSHCSCFDRLKTARGACFDVARVYRYTLWRTWDASTPPLVAILLNPSTADAEEDDRTINRIGTFARTFDAGGIIVANAFALISTDPKALSERTITAVGPENDAHLEHVVGVGGRLIVGWGSNLAREKLAFRLPKLRAIVGDRGEALHVNADGMPSHPLYIAGNRIPMPYRWAAVIPSVLA